MHLKVGKFARTWLVKICTTLRLCPKGGYPTPPLPFLYNIGNNKELPLPILWFRKTSAVAAAHIAATDDARSDGGQTDGWRADGGIETEPHRTRPASRGEADFLLSSYGWGFSVLKLPLYFHVSTCIAVLSECPSFLDASWQSLVNSAISLIQKKILERWKKSCREVLINSTSNVAVFGIKPASNFPDQRCPALSLFSSSNSTFE